MNPDKNLYVVGESISATGQAWMEGALESAEKVLTLLKDL
jgi:monoamine oxidase